MTTPSTGPISFSDIAQIIYNTTNYPNINLNDSEVRYLLNKEGSVSISFADAYSKPVANSISYGPGTYSWVVVPYENLSVTVSAGGGSGGSFCGGQFFYGCVNYCCSPNGIAGANSSFNGVVAYGGGGGRSAGGSVGTAGGNNLNSNLGGGGAGGNGNTNPAGTNCNQGAGRNGGAGGQAQKTWKKAVDGPEYKATINFTVGAGGPKPSTVSCRDQRGGPGGSGNVSISWS